MKAAEIVQVTGGRLIAGDACADIPAAAFCTDTRAIKKGDFFIALKGPRFDGNAFLEKALAKGASGALVSCPARLPRRGSRKRPVMIAVKDTTAAYGAIARRHRASFAGPVVAVTGSSGKTTTKEMIAQVLAGNLRVLKNEGTKNNHIGVPQTLLRLTPRTDIAVLELGMSHRGEIRYLAGLARPSVAVITNIGPAHLAQLGSIGNIVRAKKEVMAPMAKGGLLLANGDDERLARLASKRLAIRTFGLGAHNDIRATRLAYDGERWTFLLNGRHPCALRLMGRHNVYNALAAAAVALHYKVSPSRIAERLLGCDTAGMRLERRTVGGIAFIDDSYNANPLSMEAALDALSYCSTRGRRVLVAGDMLELGRRAAELHAETGRRVAAARVDYLLTVGRLAAHMGRGAVCGGMGRDRVRACATHEAAARELGRLVAADDVVLVKGSRAARMERVIERFGALEG